MKLREVIRLVAIDKLLFLAFKLAPDTNQGNHFIIWYRDYLNDSVKKFKPKGMKYRA